MSVYPSIYIKHNRKGSDRATYVREDLKGHEWTYMLCKDCSKYRNELKKSIKVPRMEDCGYWDAIKSLSEKLGVVLTVWECPLFDERKTVKYYPGRKGWRGSRGTRKTEEENTE